MDNNAKAIMQQHGKTFALAAKLLSPSSRHAAAQLYAFARTVDDMIDLQAAKPNMDDLQTILKTSQTQQVLQQYAISDQAMQAFLQAQIQDASLCQLENEQALIDYSYGVAGSIGAMMRPILGAPRTSEYYAASLGIAMQMTNIARDVVEDAARGRIYIPATFFESPITAQDILQPNLAQKQQIFAAIEKLLLLADSYYDYAKIGYAAIPLRNRLSIVTAGKMYQSIGKKILENGPEQYWQGRVSLDLKAKLQVAGKAIVNEIQTAKLPLEQPELQTIIKQAIASYAAK
jgi:15-cis-phytoene synthase